MSRATTMHPCLVCGKPCVKMERNADGTYAHSNCLRPQMVYPTGGKGAAGGNLYGMIDLAEDDKNAADVPAC